MINIDSEVHFGMIKIGFSGSDGIPSNKNGYICLSENSKIIFKGKANFSMGVSIRADRGVIIFGKNFFANKNFLINCCDKISFGNNIIIGWDCSLIDGNGHNVFINGNKKKISKEIIIGNHCWICANVKILKGSIIPNNCIISYNSCVLNKFNKQNSLIGGYPAKILASNVGWEL